MASLKSDAALAKLIKLHAEMDDKVADLVQHHAERLVCKRGCCDCCVDGMTVFEIEAERIRRNHGALLESGEPHAEGACAFLDEQGACRVYEDRPYVCRTQGLPLRGLDHNDAGDTVEMRDICPKNDRADAPVEKIPEGDCWTLGPYEFRLSRSQVAYRGAPPRRVELRSLFTTSLASAADG
jgi:Fe-S-cluster containining protein